jgi:hypothetical protein
MAAALARKGSLLHLLFAECRRRSGHGGQGEGIQGGVCAVGFNIRPDQSLKDIIALKERYGHSTSP